MDNRPIGILDSGMGGLSIWKELSLRFPKEQTIYVADSKNCPYGNKKEKEIYRLSKRLVKFLVENNVKLVILACNTITVSCLDKLRKDFPNIPIVGTVPVVKTASENSKNKRIGVLSTVTTAGSRYQKNLINRFAKGCRVINTGTDKLVPFVERGELGSRNLKKILKNELLPFVKEDIDALALGCSHFPFLKPGMQEILGPKVKIFDSAKAIVRQTGEVLKANNQPGGTNRPCYKFYTTSDKTHFIKISKSLVGYNKTGKISVYAL